MKRQLSTKGGLMKNLSQNFMSHTEHFEHPNDPENSNAQKEEHPQSSSKNNTYNSYAKGKAYSFRPLQHHPGPRPCGYVVVSS